MYQNSNQFFILLLFCLLFLELWNYNETQIEDLTDDEVLEVVTEALDDDSLGPLDEIHSILSGVDYDLETNQVTRARGVMNMWLLKQNSTKETGSNAIDEIAMAWEQIFIDNIIQKPIEGLPSNMKMNAMAERR